MCGIPGQSEASFEESVREAVRLGVAHVSVYPLAIEPHTPFDVAVLAGAMEPPDDDAEAAHMRVAARVLAEAGFERYEVASDARPGFDMPPQRRVLDGRAVPRHRPVGGHHDTRTPSGACACRTGR